MENTDFRSVDNKILNNYTIAAIDVSFISITKLLPKLSEINSLSEIVLLVKPQFEVGIELAKKYNGVINNKQAHIDVLKMIIKEFSLLKFNAYGVTFSPIRGGSGNIEYLVYFRKNSVASNIINVEKIVNEAFDKLIMKK